MLVRKHFIYADRMYSVSKLFGETFFVILTYQNMHNKR